MTRMRTDKSVETATSLAELRHLYTESKKHIDINVAGGSDEERDGDDSKTSHIFIVHSILYKFVILTTHALLLKQSTIQSGIRIAFCNEF